MLLHAREGHVEVLGKLRDRSVRTSELLQNPAPGGVRERGERGIDAGCRMLNHTVQYYRANWRLARGALGGHHERLSPKVAQPPLTICDPWRPPTVKLMGLDLPMKDMNAHVVQGLAALSEGRNPHPGCCASDPL